MKYLTLAEFQKTVFISDSALVRLLCGNKLKLIIDAEKGIMVDIGAVENSEIIKATAGADLEALNEQREIVIERLNAVVSENIQSLIDQALCEAGLIPQTGDAEEKNPEKQ